MTTLAPTTSSRGLLPFLVAAPLALMAGWALGTGIARALRPRTPPGNGVIRGPFGAHDLRPQTEDDPEREEVVRALLDSDQQRFDELGRPVTFALGGSSLRRQGAAPLDLSNVDE
jgi:hypothetical protein